MDSEITIGEAASDLNEPLQLDLEELSNNGTTRVKGPSGRPIRISAGKTWALIDAIDDDNIYLDMAVVARENGRFLTLGINTKGTITQSQHPDLHAGSLVDKAIAYFEKDAPLTGIDFSWRDNFQQDSLGKHYPSETLLAYRDVKASRLLYYLTEGMNRSEAEEQAQKEAAFSTWTGMRIALKYGFTEVQHLKEKSENGLITLVEGEFVRPGTPEEIPINAT